MTRRDNHQRAQGFLCELLRAHPQLAHMDMSAQHESPALRAAALCADHVLTASIAAGGDPNAQTVHGENTIKVAVRMAGCAYDMSLVLPTLRAAIRSGADINAPDISGNTVLMNAVNNAHPIHEADRREFLTTLLESGADPNVVCPQRPVDSGRNTALEIAASRGSMADFNLLIKHGADPDVCDVHPAKCAIANLHYDMARAILKRYPDDADDIAAMTIRTMCIGSRHGYGSGKEHASAEALIRQATHIPSRGESAGYSVPNQLRASENAIIRIIGWAWHVEEVAGNHKAHPKKLAQCREKALRIMCPVPIEPDLQPFCLRSILVQPDAIWVPALSRAMTGSANDSAP